MRLFCRQKRKTLSPPLIDCGANVDARPSQYHLVQFAKMGSIYMENVMGEEPKSGHRQYWCRGREGKCTGQRDFPASEHVRILILLEALKHATSRQVMRI